MTGKLSKICQLLSPERAIVTLETYSHSTSNVSCRCTGQKEPVGSFSHVHSHTLIMLIWGTAFKNILNFTRTQCPREVLPLVASAVGCKEEIAACFPCVQISPLAPWHPFSSGGDYCHWLLTVLNWVLLQEWPSAQEGCLAWGSPQLLLQRAENSAPLDSGQDLWRAMPAPNLSLGSVDALFVAAL